MKFYRCIKCGKIITNIDEEKKHLVCCGKPMEELKPRSEDASFEKHVPHCEIFGNKVRVRVGEVMHPMDENHYIEFIGYYYNNKFNKILLKPRNKPEVIFEYHEGSKVYAYCNLHGLWESEI